MVCHLHRMEVALMIEQAILKLLILSIYTNIYLIILAFTLIVALAIIKSK